MELFVDFLDALQKKVHLKMTKGVKRFGDSEKVKEGGDDASKVKNREIKETPERWWTG